MATQQPAYRAYTVVKREGQDDFWLAIGAAFLHQIGRRVQRRPASLADPGTGNARSYCARRRAMTISNRSRALTEDNKSGSRRR